MVFLIVLQLQELDPSVSCLRMSQVLFLARIKMGLCFTSIFHHI